jgi:hypothetical protein
MTTLSISPGIEGYSHFADFLGWPLINYSISYNIDRHGPRLLYFRLFASISTQPTSFVVTGTIYLSTDVGYTLVFVCFSPYHY